MVLKKVSSMKWGCDRVGAKNIIMRRENAQGDDT
jgi:hypothetical protein